MSERETISERPSIKDLCLKVQDAVLKVPGVSDMSSAPSDSFYNLTSFGKPVKGVRITDEDEPNVDIYIFVQYGVKIPQVAWDIQTVVKELLADAHRAAHDIDIHVQGVRNSEGEEYDQKRSKRTDDADFVSDGYDRGFPGRNA